MHACVSAAGESIPPFIIFPHCLPHTAYSLEGPKDALFGVSPNGYKDSELFMKWLAFFVKHAPAERPLLLIMDQHKTHGIQGRGQVLPGEHGGGGVAAIMDISVFVP